jgi:glycosyltransferase involved in cell wall biosynthesis
LTGGARQGHVDAAIDSRAPDVNAARPTRTFLVCAGVGISRRGFESFTEGCFAALRGHPALDLTLFKGGGEPGERERVIRTIPRTSALAKLVGERTDRPDFWLEQVLFAGGLLPALLAHEPEVVYFSEIVVGYVLRRLRRLTRGRYRLLFRNGKPMIGALPRWDHSQQLTPTHLALALEAGQPADSMSLVLSACDVPPFSPVSDEERRALRARLALPAGRRIAISVATLNASHKRVDYLVREVGRLGEERPFLLLLGQRDGETPAIEELARSALGREDYAIRTVPAAEVRDHLRAADVNVLCSLSEGSPRTLMEALAEGKACVAHDMPESRFVLGDAGFFADLSGEGALRAPLERALAAAPDRERALRAYALARRFSWETLTEEYVALIQRCARGPIRSP